MRGFYSNLKSCFLMLSNIGIIVAIFLTCSASSYAQTITGTVIDDTGEILPGVTVMVKGANSGSSTNYDGKYVIEASANSVLVFSYIGMNKQEIAVNGRKTINVTMQSNSKGLDEVVVVGYGTQKKTSLTGSVASVGSADLLKTTASNMSQTLVGKIPGLITQQSVGTPGADDVSLLIRGYSSYNDAGSVLTLVDGVQREMWRVDPNDIESVTVLKDAAACAVYGMKASNGVVLVTTKKGSEGKTSINYRGSATFNHATAMPKMMNGTQYMQYYNLGLYLDSQAAGTAYTPFFTTEDIEATFNGDPTDGFENTDWTSPIYNTTLLHQHNISVSGGSKKVQYYISGGFKEHYGIIKDNKNQQWNLRSNITTQVTNDIKVDLNLATRQQDYYQPGGYSYANQAAYNVFHLMLYSLPFVPQEYDGMATSAYRSSGNAANAIYGSANSGSQRTKTTRIETSAKVEYAMPFLKGLKASMFFSYDWQDQESKTFSYAYDLMQYNFTSKSYNIAKSANFLEGGNMYQGDSKQYQTVIRPTIQYNNTFGAHDIGVTLLYEQTDIRSNVMTATRRDFNLFDLPELNFGATAGATNSGSSGHSRYAGYVGRFNYGYDSKYLAELAFRYDGSYLFAKGHRWGFFPSASLGWVVSGENWFKDTFSKIDHFKVRASAGLLGNDNVPAFLYRKTFTTNNNAVVFGTNPTSQMTMYSSTPYIMNDLTWEKTSSFNLGFDMNMWHGLLGVELDLFYKYTYDILQNIAGTYPASLGGSVPTRVNDGKFDNKGFEISLKHRNNIGKFYYSATGNLSYAHNRILSKRQADGVLPWQSVLGNSIGEIYGLKSDGLYQSQAEIDNSPRIVGNTPRVGDIKYVDINGDGKINGDDYVKIARSTRPEMMFSLALDGQYQGFDCSILVQGAALCDKMLTGTYNNGVADATPLTVPFYAGYDNSPLYLMENSWRPDNTNAEYPRLSVNKASHSNNFQVSDFWKRNGAYCRLKNVVIGYSLPKSILKKGISNCRVYVSGQNLLTLTQFKYTDPESSNVITGYYPQQRTISVGIDISL